LCFLSDLGIRNRIKLQINRIASAAVKLVKKIENTPQFFEGSDGAAAPAIMILKEIVENNQANDSYRMRKPRGRPSTPKVE